MDRTLSLKKVKLTEIPEKYFEEEEDETCAETGIFDNQTTFTVKYELEDLKGGEKDSDAHDQDEGKVKNEQKHLNNRLLYNQKRRFSSTTSLYNLNNNENKKRGANKTTRRYESGIQRLEYELSNLKSRLFDNLQEFEDLKDSFPDKNFPPEWEPPPIRHLRSKVSRLSERIKREKNKLKMKANDKEVKRMVESLLDQCGDENIDDDLDPLEQFTVTGIVKCNTELNKKKVSNDNMKFQKHALTGGSFCKVPKELKTRQRKLFIAGDNPPRTPSEREASQAALHCALSRLPPISRRIKARKFGKISSNEEQERKKFVLIPNKRRLVNGRAFVHERQKEFVSFHKKRLHQIDVTFSRTAFESLN